MNINKKLLILILATIGALVVLSYAFDDGRGPVQQEDVVRDQEVLDGGDLEIKAKEDNQQSESDNESNGQTVVVAEPEQPANAQENTQETKTENAEIRKPGTFVGKIYSASKDGSELSKFDDYIFLDSGEKYGLKSRKEIGPVELISIIDEVIISYRDTDRTAEIRGVLVMPFDDFGGAQIQVEEIKDITQ